jgi:uncharacterized Zn finger protein
VEKKPDDVLRWYDRLTGEAGGRYLDWGVGALAGRVADAVADTYPERAMELYRQTAAGHIAHASPSGYEAALPPLRKLRDLLGRLGRADEWSRYLHELRQTHRRKRRLMEVLDRLENRRIVDG